MAFFSSFVTFLESSKYFLIFAGSFIEGSAVMMGTGLLWHLGTVSFWPAYLALLLGDVLSDTMWYFVGYFGARRFFNGYGHWFGITPLVIEKVERRFHHYHLNILIISKLTMGFGLAVPVLTVSGMLRVPFLRYLTINIIGGLIWILFLMEVGYYFGNVLEYIPKDFQLGMALLVPVLFFVLLRKISAKLATVDW